MEFYVCMQLRKITLTRPLQDVVFSPPGFSVFFVLRVSSASFKQSPDFSLMLSQRKIPRIKSQSKLCKWSSSNCTQITAIMYFKAKYWFGMANGNLVWQQAKPVVLDYTGWLFQAFFFNRRTHLLNCETIRR